MPGKEWIGTSPKIVSKPEFSTVATLSVRFKNRARAKKSFSCLSCAGKLKSHVYAQKNESLQHQRRERESIASSQLHELTQRTAPPPQLYHSFADINVVASCIDQRCSSPRVCLKCTHVVPPAARCLFCLSPQPPPSKAKTANSRQQLKSHAQYRRTTDKKGELDHFECIYGNDNSCSK